MLWCNDRGWIKWGDPLRFQPSLNKCMGLVHDYCVKHGIEYWMDYGNIIGAVRHERLIPWDHDLDAGLTVENYQKLLAAMERDPLPAPLEAYSAPDSGYTMIWCDNMVWCDMVPYRYDAERGAWISACIGAQCHDPTDRENYCVPIAKDWLYPLKTAKLGDRSYPVPNDCDSYLKTQYGNYWSFLFIPVFWSWLYHPIEITKFVWHYLTVQRKQQQAKYLNPKAE